VGLAQDSSYGLTTAPKLKARGLAASQKKRGIRRYPLKNPNNLLEQHYDLNEHPDARRSGRSELVVGRLKSNCGLQILSSVYMPRAICKRAAQQGHTELSMGVTRQLFCNIVESKHGLRLHAREIPRPSFNGASQGDQPVSSSIKKFTLGEYGPLTGLSQFTLYFPNNAVQLRRRCSGLM